MPLFDYTGADERYYPAIGRTVQPGDAGIEFDEAPSDGRWQPVVKPKAVKAAAPKSEES